MWSSCLHLETPISLTHDAETEAKMDISAFLLCLFMTEELVEKWPTLILGSIIIRDAKIAYEKIEIENFSMDFEAALSYAWIRLK